MVEFGVTTVVVIAFPLGVRPLLISLAVSFLHNNGFRFDLPITHGVPYLSRKEEEEVRTNMRTTDATNAALPNMAPKDEDIPLLAHIREVVTKWQSNPKDEQDDYLNIPHEANDPAIPETLNRYQIRLTHQTVRNEFPGLKTQGMGHFVQITNPTSAQLESQQSILERQREREISSAIGFRWLVEVLMGGNISNIPEEYFAPAGDVGEKAAQASAAKKERLPQLQEKLRARRRILVGHNCFTDLVNLYKCFIGDLPEKLEDFQDSVHALFPAIIDTKHIASFGGKAYGDTSLGNVHSNIDVEEYPKIEVPSAFERYDQVESYHEAGYDSFQTAKILIKLSAALERQDKLKGEQTTSVIEGRRFGMEEDYVTAPESQSDGGPPLPTITQTITKALSSPVTAMKNLLLNESSSPAEPKSAGMWSIEAVAGSPVSNSGSPPARSSSVVAAKETKLETGSSAAAEVKKLKSKFGSVNAFNVLNGEKADSDDDVTPDLIEWSDEEEKKKEKREKKRLEKLAWEDRIEKMVEKGELMPRWDGAKGFWRFFGNKLQANGTVENVCHLA